MPKSRKKRKQVIERFVVVLRLARLKPLWTNVVRKCTKKYYYDIFRLWRQKRCTVRAGHIAMVANDC